MASSERAKFYDHAEFRWRHSPHLSVWRHSAGEPWHAVGTNLGAQTLELLAFLLTHSDSPLPRNFVAATLWPDDAENDGLSRLRRYLFRLNAALPVTSDEPWILSDKGSIQWNRSAPAWVDVWRFREACVTPETHDEAVRTYTGELLSTFEGDWIDGLRNDLRNAYEAVLLQCVDASRQKNDLHAALHYADRLSISDPWREDVVRALMEVHVKLKDRAGAMNVFHEFAGRLRSELQVEPMIETRAFYERIVQESKPAFQRLNNLRASVTSFVGRDVEVSTLRTMLLSTDRRIITLVGPGGVGKSRLALEVTRSLCDDFSGGVWVVELARVGAGDRVAKAIAETLDFPEEPNRNVIDSVCAALRTQEVLVVLDNCEHVLAEAAIVAATVAKRCPSTRVVSTSREILRIEGETRFSVAPLPVPPRHHDGVPAVEYPSVELFVERASRHGANIANSSVEVEHWLWDIARRLDGLPLAIELAATHLSVLSLSELARGLDDMFELLVDGSRDALPQHRTMRALVDWSVKSLSEAELAMLEYMAVFAGGMILQAAVSFCGGDGSLAIRHLSSLVEKSLITMESGKVVTRYGMLESVASYAREGLSARGLLGERRLQHAKWCLEYAGYGAARRGRESLETWLPPLRDELENFRAALEFCLGGVDPELGAQLASVLNWMFLDVAPFEGLQWIESALAALPESANPERVAELYLAIGRYGGVAETKITRVDATERALAIYERLGDANAATRARQGLALSLVSAQDCTEDDLARALSLARLNVEFLRAHGTVRDMEDALSQFGLIAGYAGDDDTRHRAFAESLTLRGSPDLETARARVASFNGFVETRRNNPAAARRYWEEARAIYATAPERRGIQHMRALQELQNRHSFLRIFPAR